MSQSDIDAVNSIANLYGALRAERDAALAQLAAVTQQRDALREAVEGLLPYIHEDNMKGESGYERAVLALEVALQVHE